ncbi:MAG: hypothetical protein ACI835_000195 [Planctomycetota bacterium]|jgi:hypothetical protein
MHLWLACAAPQFHAWPGFPQFGASNTGLRSLFPHYKRAAPAKTDVRLEAPRDVVSPGVYRRVSTEWRAEVLTAY